MIEIGLGVLLLKFEDEAKQHEDQPVDFKTQIVKNMSVERLLQQARETKVPNSELARLVNRSLYE
ncbi:hypothetical protein ACFLZ8_03905 [Planctomycetota bacterium]